MKYWFCLLLTGWLLMVSKVLSASENRFYVYNAANGLSDNSAQTITCTKTGRLVITTSGQINFFDGQKFSFIDPSTENVYPLPSYSGHYHLYFDHYHHLWLKYKHAVTCVNLTTERFEDSIKEVFESFGFTDLVEDMFVDQRNEIWVLTAKGLICSKEKQTIKVRRDLNLQDLAVSGNTLLLFFENGLVEVYDVQKGRKMHDFRIYGDELTDTYKKTSLVYVTGNSVFQIRNGSNHGILVRFDIGEWNPEVVTRQPYYLSNISEKDSTLYIPCAYGYWTYNLSTRRLVHTERLQMATGELLLTDINAMTHDRQGGLWVCTEKRGLLYSRPKPTPFNVYGWNNPRATELAELMDRELTPRVTYRDKTVNCVYSDSRGWDWVGTNMGLHLYRKASDRLPQVITRQDGLLNNVVHSVIEDGKHHIWVGTSFGLSCLVFDGNSLRYINSYNQWDGIPAESFSNGRAIRLPDGRLAMQMLDHVVEWNPDEMVTITESMKQEIYPKLIKLLVNGVEIKTGMELDGNVILPKALSRTAEIDLNYDQNSLSLTFSALNYFRPQQTYYRIRVNGFDDTWRILTQYNSGGLVDRQGQLHLPLTGLKPGTYRVEVQTSMLPDTWESTPYEWVINVNEPWWRTTGMLLLLGTVIFMLLAINLLYLIKNSNMRAQRNSEELGLVSKFRSFAERCIEQNGQLEPTMDEIHGISIGDENDLSPEFIDMMLKLVPLMKNRGAKMSLRELSEAVNMEVSYFYQLLMGNIYKNPRPLRMLLMLKKAALALETTNEDLGTIAYNCGFVSANYLIASFYRQYKMTPEAYRRKYGQATIGA
ncbi:MAG: helix-turn-helix domain-containing protein [Prevotella sp.]|nr:helix-turn-helix domain-containing protein [Prevotella sp.]